MALVVHGLQWKSIADVPQRVSRVGPEEVSIGKSDDGAQTSLRREGGPTMLGRDRNHQRGQLATREAAEAPTIGRAVFFSAHVAQDPDELELEPWRDRVVE